MAALGDYWNLDKGITDYTSFSGSRAGDNTNFGGGGWGGNGGVVPEEAFQNWASWAVNQPSTDDVIGSLWNATPNAAPNEIIFQNYSNVNGNWYNSSTTTIDFLHPVIANFIAQYQFNQNQYDRYYLGLLASVTDPPGGKNKIPTVPENTLEVLTAASITLSTAAACAIECPPVAAGLGVASFTASSVLLYNSLATQYNNGDLHWTKSNTVDAVIFVGSALNPTFGAVVTWIYIVPTTINNRSKTKKK